jgi:precorrin-2 dehydrogenase/sirohydrochlorin ferrochelatase
MSYPVNLPLTGRRAVVVGAGAIMKGKIVDLINGGAAVTVVAPDVSEEVRALADAGRIVLQERPYHDGDLKGAFLVVAFTGSEELNAQVSRDAQGMGILVNVVDRPLLCTFTLPAVVRRGDLTLAVATDGRCPAFSSVLRRELESRYGPEYGEVLGMFSELRNEMIARQWGSARIQEAISGLYHSGLVELVLSRRFPEIERMLRERLGDGFPLPRWMQGA